MRNSAAARFGANRYVLAGMVDTSGYSSEIRAKYEGFLITDSPITVGGSELATGRLRVWFQQRRQTEHSRPGWKSDTFRFNNQGQPAQTPAASDDGQVGKWRTTVQRQRLRRDCGEVERTGILALQSTYEVISAPFISPHVTRRDLISTVASARWL